MSNLDQLIDLLRKKAAGLASRSYAPYTGRQEGVVILLETGDLIPGVRVENASFQLSISALHNALSTMYGMERKDIALIASSAPLTESDLAYTSGIPSVMWELVGGTVLMVQGAHYPDPGDYLSPTSEGNLLELARLAAQKAFTPESDFPVGSAINTTSGEVLTGSNVEHTDWLRILCAERNVLSTAFSYGYDIGDQIFVSCPKEPGGTPCGACRQVIVELAPDATVWMDRGNQEPIAMKATELLPGHFTGNVLTKQ